MRQYLVRVIDNTPLWSHVRQITIDSPELSAVFRPGQCALVRNPIALDPYVRHTAWLHTQSQERISVILFSPEDDSIIRQAVPGSILDFLAPIGHALTFDSARHILCIGQDERVSRLIPVMHSAILSGCSVVLWMSAPMPQSLLPAYLLPAQVEYRTAGDALDQELLLWADQVLACGSENLYRSLLEWARLARYRVEPNWALALIAPRMPCGNGACYACAIETRDGVRLACTDGPFFDLLEIEPRRTP